MSCPIKRGVMLAGGICSGKSTIVDFLRREYSIGVVSFGDFVKRECAVRGLTATREALQVLGYELFQSLGPKLLVDSAIQYATLPNTPVVLFDGVRDVSVVREIRVRCEKSVCLFLEADLAVRYARFTSRAS